MTDKANQSPGQFEALSFRPTEMENPGRSLETKSIKTNTAPFSRAKNLNRTSGSTSTQVHLNQDVPYGLVVQRTSQTPVVLGVNTRPIEMGNPNRTLGSTSAQAHLNQDVSSGLPAQRIPQTPMTSSINAKLTQRSSNR